MARLTVCHIPACPFSQPLEILLALKGVRDKVNFQVVDLTPANSSAGSVLPTAEQAEQLAEYPKARLAWPDLSFNSLFFGKTVGQLYSSSQISSFNSLFFKDNFRIKLQFR